MLQWLGRKKQPSDSSTPAEQLVALSARDLDRQFAGLLLGIHSFTKSALTPWEKEILSQTKKLSADGTLSNTRLIPRLPTVLPELMVALKKDRDTTEQLAEKVAKDPVVVAEMLQLANSAYYFRGQPIDDLTQAITLLGRDGIKKLIFNVSMRPIYNLKAGHFSQLAGSHLWEQAEKAAVVASCIANKNGLSQFEAYLGGLMQNIGFIAGIRLLDEAFEKQPEAPRSEKFWPLWLDLSRRLTYLIAINWEFPENVIVALKSSNSARDINSINNLSDAVYAGSKMAQLHQIINSGLLGKDINTIEESYRNKFTVSCFECYQQLNRELEQP